MIYTLEFSVSPAPPALLVFEWAQGQGGISLEATSYFPEWWDEVPLSLQMCDPIFQACGLFCSSKMLPNSSSSSELLSS